MRLLLPVLLAACESSAPSPAPAAPTAPPSVPEPLPASAISGASATSELNLNDTTYGARDAVDGDRATAWCEGEDGLGDGATLTVTLKAPTALSHVRIDGGYFKDDRALVNNGRPRKATLNVDGGDPIQVLFPLVVERRYRAKKIPVKPVDVPINAEARTVSLTLVSSDKGRASEDVCISEIAFFGS